MHHVASMYRRKSVIHCLLARNFSTFISVGVLVSFVSLFLKYQRSSDLQKKEIYLVHAGICFTLVQTLFLHYVADGIEENPHMNSTTWKDRKPKWEGTKFFYCNNSFWAITGIPTKTNSVSSNSSIFISPYLLITTTSSYKEDKSHNTQTLGETNTFQAIVR